MLMKKKLTLIILCCLPLLTWAQNITFADATVKAICVENWDTNGNGELSLYEASTVKDLGTVFRFKKIKQFQELQYFTGLTSIGDEAFHWCSSLTSIIIPEGVTSIGDEAFYYCSSLTSIVIPEGVTSIGNSAFSFCSGLTSITIPEGVTSIGNSAFSHCSGLTSITIPEGVTSIGDRAFEGCSGLTSIVIPEGVTSIGGRAFGGCSGLTSITIPESVISISDGAFVSCYGLTSITIPEGVTSIGNSAFSSCWVLTSITIPEGVTSIGNSAFHNCRGLTSITIPEGVTSIGDEAFGGCSGLTSITIPSSVSSIGGGAFDGCSGLTSIAIPEGVTSIGNSAFYRCSGLTSITIPSSVTSIGDCVFYNCSGLIKMTVRMKTPPSIGSSTFYDFNLANATLYVPVGSKSAYEAAAYWQGFGEIVGFIPFADDNVKTLCLANWDTNGDGELSDDEAAAVTDLGNVFKQNFKITSFDELRYFTGLTSIGNSTFYNCRGLTSITIPEGVTSISDEAFEDCSGLTSISIPEGVTSIGEKAFAYCSSLTSITISKGVTNIGNCAFQDCPGLTSIVVDADNTAYTSANGSNAIIEKATNKLIFGCNNTVIPWSVTSIGNCAFDGRPSLTSITIPSSVTSIGNWAFADCSGLTEVLSMIKEPFAISTNCWSEVHTGDIPLYVPKGTKQLYEATEGWSVFKNIIEKDYEFFVKDAVYMDETQARQGSTMTLSLKMKNSVPIRGFQFDLYLPQGVTVAKNAKGKILGALSADRLPDEDEHTLTLSEQSDGAIRFLCTSQYDETFTGNDGEIATLQVIIGQDMEEGDYFVQLKDIKLTETNISRYYETGLVRSYLTIEPCLLGDINSDGTVDVSDYTGVANHIHGNTPAGFFLKAGDVDVSGRIDISDYTGIANIIHTGSIYGNSGSRALSRSPKKENTDVSTNNNVIYVEPFTVELGAQTAISFKMKNTAEIRGFQFDLYLPEGVTVVKSSKGRIQGALSAGRLPEDDDHDLSFSEQPDGAIRFLCSSQYDETFTGNDGEIVTLQIEVAENMAGGNYPVVLKRVKLTETDIANFYVTEEVETTLSVLLKGDVNGDGFVTAEDVTALVDFILGRGTLVNEAAAYVNDDDKIDIADVAALIALVGKQ